MEEIYYNEDYKAWWATFDHNPEGNMHTIESGIGAIEVVNLKEISNGKS